jgi:hypothetical protein
MKIRVLAWLTGPTGLAATGVLAFQRLYYGNWLPNTYHLKMDGHGPQTRIHRGLIVSGKILPLVVLLLLVVALVFLRGSEKARRLAAAATTSCVLGVLYSIWVGGDAWEDFLLLNRYVSVVLPAAVTLVFVGVGVLYQHAGPLARRWAAPLVLVVVAGVADGLTSNPYEYMIGYAVVLMLLTLVALRAFVAVISRQQQARTRSQHAVAVGCAAALMMAATTSIFPLSLWAAGSDATHIEFDQLSAQQADVLADVTEHDAVIAVITAGAPAYYTSRSMIDLLGKSDPTIARMVPVDSFYPGHDKRDYRYSIGTLLPDVVLRPWTSEEDLRNLTGWGYVPGCFSTQDHQPSFFRAGSPLVRWADITVMEPGFTCDRHHGGR